MQTMVKLSVIESELDSTVSTAQDMIFVKDIVENMELKVELPMILNTDNKGCRILQINGPQEGGQNMWL